MMNFNLIFSSKLNKTFSRCQNVKNSLYVIYILLLGIALVIGESDAAGLENTVIAVYQTYSLNESKLINMSPQIKINFGSIKGHK